MVDALKLDFIADTSKLNHSVQEFSSIQKKLSALIAILARWITKDIVHPVKDELFDCALSEKAADYQQAPVHLCDPAIPVLPAEVPGTWPPGERRQLGCSSGPLNDLM